MKRKRAGKASAVDRSNRIGGGLEGIGIREETNMKKALSMILAVSLCAAALTGCGGSASSSAAASSEAGSAAAAGTKYKVGICQLVEHDALDAAS